MKKVEIKIIVDISKMNVGKNVADVLKNEAVKAVNLYIPDKYIVAESRVVEEDVDEPVSPEEEMMDMTIVEEDVDEPVGPEEEMMDMTFDEERDGDGQ